MDLKNMCVCLNNTGQIKSNLDGVAIVFVEYTSTPSDNININIDNEEKTISATIKEIQFDSAENFPEIGSDRLIYVDKSQNMPYRWDSETKSYKSLGKDLSDEFEALEKKIDDISKETIKDIKVNNETSVGEDKIANIFIGALTTSTTTQSEVTAGESFTNNIVLHKVAKTGLYSDLLNKPNIIDNLNSTSTTDILSANQGNVLKSMVQALPSAKSFANIQSMITALNGYGNSEMNVGTNIYLQQTDVPDFWVYSKADSSVAYTYTNDSAFINAVKTSGYVQVGYYNVAMLETAKVDLTDYYTKTEVDNLIDSIGTIPTINVNGVAQSTINFDSDPQTQIDDINDSIGDINNSIGDISTILATVVTVSEV